MTDGALPAQAGVRRAFVAFHLTLGLALFYLSVRTVLHALAAAGGQRDPHVALLASVEAIGAALFLLPRTVRVGGVLLLLTILVAVVVHAATAGELRADLLVYAAGTWFVMVHGSGWQGAREGSAGGATAPG